MHVAVGGVLETVAGGWLVVVVYYSLLAFWCFFFFFFPSWFCFSFNIVRPSLRGTFSTPLWVFKCSG